MLAALTQATLQDVEGVAGGFLALYAHSSLPADE